MTKITQDELRELFGETIPIEVISLLWSSPPEMAIGEVREKVREMAGPLDVRMARQIVERLRDDPRVWATHGVPGEAKLQLIRDAIADGMRRYAKEIGVTAQPQLD